MERFYRLIQLCSILLFAGCCAYAPPIISYLLLAGLLMRAFVFIYPTKGDPVSPGKESRKALVVVDLQEALCGENGVYPNRQALVQAVNAQVRQAQAEDSLIIYVQQVFHYCDIPFCFLAMGGLLLKGTSGTALCAGAASQGAVFVKHHQDAFTCEVFSQYLKDHKVGEMTVVGLDASACVYKTALGAANRGYHVTVLRDAVLSRNAAFTERALKKLSAKAVQIA